MHGLVFLLEKLGSRLINEHFGVKELILLPLPISYWITEKIGEIQTSTTEKGLVEFALEETKVVSRIPKLPVTRDVTPFENQTPSGILSRERLVSTIVLTSSTANEVQFVSVFLLMQAAANLAAAQSFRYIRWSAIKWRVITQANPFVFGWYGLTCVPTRFRNTSPLGFASDYGWLSHDDCLVVDLTSMPESQITVPWAFNNTWVDLNLWRAGNAIVVNEIDSLNGLKVVFPQTIFVTSSDIPATCTLSIYCQFEGVEVAGPMSPGATFEAQSSWMDWMIPSGEPKTAPVETEKEARFRRMKEHYQDDSAGFYSNEHVVEPALPLTVDDKNEDQEAESANVIPSVFGSMVKGQPRNVLGSGTMKLPPRMSCQNKISQILQKPSLVGLKSFISLADPGFTVPIYGGVGNGSNIIVSRNDCSRIRFMAQFFRFYRGSLTYTIMFLSSPMVTWRVKVTVSFQNGSMAAIPPGDTLQQVVTIRGTTVHQVHYPYLYTTPWRSVATANQDAAGYDVVPEITVYPISVSQCGDTFPVLYMLAYESANSDFQFASQQNPLPYSSTPPTEFTAQASISLFRHNDFANQLPSGESATFTSDNCDTIEGMAKRWSSRSDDSTLTRAVYDPVTLETNSTLDCLASIFYYCRGQVKFKVSFEQSSTDLSSALVIAAMDFEKAADTSFPYYNHRFEDGMHIVSLGLTQVLEYCTPFLCTVDWYQTLESPGYVGAVPRLFRSFILADGNGGVTPSINWVGVSAGPDFSFCFNTPPPCNLYRWYDAASPTLSAKDETSSFSDTFEEGIPAPLTSFTSM